MLKYPFVSRLIPFLGSWLCVGLCCPAAASLVSDRFVGGFLVVYTYCILMRFFLGTSFLNSLSWKDCRPWTSVLIGNYPQVWCVLLLGRICETTCVVVVLFEQCACHYRQLSLVTSSSPSSSHFPPSLHPSLNLHLFYPHLLVSLARLPHHPPTFLHPSTSLCFSISSTRISPSLYLTPPSIHIQSLLLL